ncbi:MAG: OmpH family outer membrane protein [Proteobacteria bacterium]|nr:OmpH family outer membrane protein [Pseudomonadota bacterium]
MKQTPKNYAKIGIIAAAVVVVAGLGLWGVGYFSHPSLSKVLSDVSPNAVTGADLRIAVVRMDEIQNRASVLVDLRKQKESFENKLRDQLNAEQKALEKEKADIEKSQDVLSREALQRRVADYQQRIAKLQRDVSDRAQAIDAAFQAALVKVQNNNLDPIINGIIEKKKLSLVLDGRFARVSDAAAASVDITGDVVTALDKMITSMKMETPKGF